MATIQKLLLTTMCLLVGASSLAAPSSVKATHLEELVIWKVSDELQLKAADEKAFAEIIKKLNSEKALLSEQMQNEISALKDETSEKKLQSLLKAHRLNISKYSKLNEKEYDQLLKLLGPQKMSKYLLLKQDITKRIKTLLSSPDGKPLKEPLPTPKIIE